MDSTSTASTSNTVVATTTLTAWNWSTCPGSTQAFDGPGPRGEGVRSASVGQLSVVYWSNRLAGRLYVIDIVWLG